MGFLHQGVEGFQVAEDRVNAGVVGDIIAKIDHRRWVERRDPEGIYAQPGEVVELRENPLQITNAITVAVLEAPRVNLVDDSTLPPQQLITRHMTSKWNLFI